MRKEQLKSFILAMLIINSIFLTTQIWFDEKLWPNGYNFFHSLKNMPIIGQIIESYGLGETVQDTSSFEDITLPYRMIVSSSNRTRAVHYQDSAEYDEIKADALAVADLLLESELQQYMLISRNEWFSSLEGNSILLDFGSVMKMRLMARARNKPDTQLISLVDDFSEIIITPSDRESNFVFVYIRDVKDENYYRFNVLYDRQKVRRLTDAYSGEKQQAYAFAFELELHRKMQDTDQPVERRYLDPLVLLPLEMIEKQPVLHMKNPLMGDVNPNVYEQVVRAFGLQPNNLRRSVSSNGTVSYIENKATVEISPSGRIEYKAADQKNGIWAETIYDKISLIWEIAHNQWEVIGINQPFNVRINSDLSKDNQANATITMNYMYKGVPIIMDTDAAGYGSCITAEFVENRLIKFNMLIRSTERTEEYTEAAFVLEALDNIYSKVQTDEEIQNVFICYIMNEWEQSFESSVTWAVKQADKTFVAD